MTAITVDHVTKVYHLYDSPTARMKEALRSFRKKYHHNFYAQNGLTNPVQCSMAERRKQYTLNTLTEK